MALSFSPYTKFARNLQSAVEMAPTNAETPADLTSRRRRRQYLDQPGLTQEQRRQRVGEVQQENTLRRREFVAKHPVLTRFAPDVAERRETEADIGKMYLQEGLVAPPGLDTAYADPNTIGGLRELYRRERKQKEDDAEADRRAKMLAEFARPSRLSLESRIKFLSPDLTPDQVEAVRGLTEKPTQPIPTVTPQGGRDWIIDPMTGEPKMLGLTPQPRGTGTPGETGVTRDPATGRELGFEYDAKGNKKYFPQPRAGSDKTNQDDKSLDAWRKEGFKLEREMEKAQLDLEKAQGETKAFGDPTQISPSDTKNLVNYRKAGVAADVARKALQMATARLEKHKARSPADPIRMRAERAFGLRPPSDVASADQQWAQGGEGGAPPTGGDESVPYQEDLAQLLSDGPQTDLPEDWIAWGIQKVQSGAQLATIQRALGTFMHPDDIHQVVLAIAKATFAKQDYTDKGTAGSGPPAPTQTPKPAAPIGAPAVQPAPVEAGVKPTAEERYRQLKAEGLDKEAIYKKMRDEGY